MERQEYGAKQTLPDSSRIGETNLRLQSKGVMLLYYITDRNGFPGTEAERRAALLRRIGEAAHAGVDYIQLREKDLAPRILEELAHETVRIVRDHSQLTRLLINGRSDIALACGADGVHLPSGELPASEVRALWTKSSARKPVIGVSAHSIAEVREAEAHGADFAVLAPIFEKERSSAGIGVGILHDACAGVATPGDVEAPYFGRFAVLALGGVNLRNARACLEAGAAGIAGIRLFQNAEIAQTVRLLRGLQPSASLFEPKAR